MDFWWLWLFLWHKCKNAIEIPSTQQTKVLSSMGLRVVFFFFFSILLFVLCRNFYLSHFIPSRSVRFWNRSDWILFKLHSSFSPTRHFKRLLFFLTRMWSWTGKLFDATHFKQPISLMGTIFASSENLVVACQAHRVLSPNWLNNKPKIK